MKIWIYISIGLWISALGLAYQNLSFRSELHESKEIAGELLNQNLQLENELKSTKTYINKRINIEESETNEEAFVQEIKKQHIISDSDIWKLKRKGLSNPIVNLKASLIDHQSILLTDSLIDGPQRFFEDYIHVISDQWV